MHFIDNYVSLPAKFFNSFHSSYVHCPSTLNKKRSVTRNTYKHAYSNDHARIFYNTYFQCGIFYKI